jgi:hypothetical protein
MRQTYAARQTVRAGTGSHHGESRNGKGESGIRLRMVPAPGGVAFVEDKLATEMSQATRQVGT